MKNQRLVSDMSSESVSLEKNMLEKHHQVRVGMPYLLANGELNLNHFSKILGDLHWRYQNLNPSLCNANGKRIYHSFLRINFNIKNLLKEDDNVQITTSGIQLDDFIYKTTHRFFDSSVDMYTIPIHVDNHKIIRSASTGKKDINFWKSLKEEKRYDFLNNVETYSTSYLIDFNSAGILYCANYLNFVYRYMNARGFQKIKKIDFFGNIFPNENIKIGSYKNFIIMADSKDHIIAKVTLENNLRNLSYYE